MIGAEFTRAEIEAAARDGRLLSMEIEFSLRCNFHCQYCYVNQDHSAPNELTPDEIRDTLLQAKALGARKIIVLGGEPMIYPRILEMLAFIREQGMAAEMFTNGTQMTAEAARRLRELGVHVVLKMNSFDPAVQDRLAGMKGAHQIIQDAYDNLLAAGYPGPDRMMAVSTVICAQNLAEVPHMWQWLRDRQITPYFEIITPQGNARDNSMLDVDLPTLHATFTELARLDRTKYGIEWDPQPPLVGDRCLRHQFSCLVNAFGAVSPCVGVTIPVGNIRERKLADILRSSEIIQDLRCYTDTIRGPCAACEKAAICYGCRGAAYQLTGDYLASDPLCWRNVDRAAEIMTLPAPIADLIPQQPPWRIVNRILSFGERVAELESTVQPDNPFAQADGALDGAVFVELMAQAAAAMDGFRTAHRARCTSTAVDRLPDAYTLEIAGTARVGDTLNIRLAKTTDHQGMGLIEGQILRGSELLARGTVTVRGAACSGEMNRQPV